MGNILRLLWSPWKLWQRTTTTTDPEPVKNQFIEQAFRMVRRGDVAALQVLLMDPEHASEAMPLAKVTDPSTGRTLLHAAMERAEDQDSSQRSRDLLHFLISTCGCDPTKGDNSRETPLHAACMSDRLDNLKFVLGEGEGEVLGQVKVDLEVKDVWNRTLLLKAVVYNSPRVTDYLLSLGANVNTQDVFKLSAVHVAVTLNSLDLVRKLASRGADLNLLNERGRSPLSLAVTGRNVDMVRELLALGARTDAHCRHGEGNLIQMDSMHHASFSLPVVSAIWEHIRRLEAGVVCPLSGETLHLMLAAHGHPLHSDPPNVIQNILSGHDIHRFLPLIYKLLICSDSTCDGLQSWLEMQSSSSSTSSSSLSSSLSSSFSGRYRRRKVLRLFDLARRSARLALMASGRNVMWGAERLGSNLPPAVKGWLVMKDCDFKQFSLSSELSSEG